MPIMIVRGQIWEDPTGNTWEVYQEMDLVGTVIMRRGPIQLHVASEALESESGWKLIQGA